MPPLPESQGQGTIAAVHARRAAPNIVLIDDAMDVVMTGASDIWRSAGVEVRIGTVLPSVLADFVLQAREQWRAAPPLEQTALFFPWPGIGVRIYPVDVAGGVQVCLSAERFRARRDLRWAARAYSFSPREMEILRHVLRGAATPEIAQGLGIAQSTVIAHIKSLLLKTKASNRAALVARVLGWEDSVAP